jgi:dihydroorotate dehydrogenase electron transfer subunit
VINSSGLYRIISNEQVAEDTWSLSFRAPGIAELAVPGQFLNVLTSAGIDPLLRRPYSISRICGDVCYILYAVVGKGTQALKRLRPGDLLDVLGPLGNGFPLDGFSGTAILVAGGIGVAPFFHVTESLASRGVPVTTFIGCRSASRAYADGLLDVHYATDDGSLGYHGNVVECLEKWLEDNTPVQPAVFACGPNPMLEALREYALSKDMPCWLSLESEMACGVGICQGCAVEHLDGPRKYALVCTDGPCFDAGKIKFRDKDRA